MSSFVMTIVAIWIHTFVCLIYGASPDIRALGHAIIFAGYIASLKD